MKIRVVFRTFKASQTRVPAMSLPLPFPMGTKQVSHSPTWLHITTQGSIFPQNLQNWFVGINLDVKKNTKPMITIPNSTKTMPENIHVNTDLTFCNPFLIWHQWPYIGHKALFIGGLLLAMLCLQNWFVDMTLFIMALLSILAFCHTWLHFATHSYTCSLFSFLLLIGLLLHIVCLQNWFIDMTLFIMAY